MYKLLDIRISNGDIVLEEFMFKDQYFVDVDPVGTPTSYLLQQLGLIQQTQRGQLVFNRLYGIDIPFVYAQLTNVATGQFRDYVNDRIAYDIQNSLNLLDPVSVSARYEPNQLVITVTHGIGDDKREGEIKFMF